MTEALRRKGRWSVLAAVGLGSFLTALDTSAVNAILPTIRGKFGADFEQAQWVITIYLLGLTGLQLSFGRLGDARGHRTIFSLGFVVFVVSSVACALSQSLAQLIGARALQAVGGAMISANAPALLTQHFPARERGRVLGLQASMVYLGLTLGPSLGGWLADAWDWHGIFWINAPLCAAALVIIWTVIPADPGRELQEPFDLLGAALFLTGMVAFMIALNRGPDWGWGSPLTLGILCAAAALGVVFYRLESRLAAPMLDLRLFHSWEFSSATLCALANYIAIYAVVYLTPHTLITLRGWSTAEAGRLLTAQPLMMALISPWAGNWSDRVGTRLPSTLGLLIMSAGLLVLAFQSASTSWVYLAFGLGLAGLGTGLFTSPNNSALLGAAPRDRQGIASALLATARNGGMVLGVGLAGAVVSTAEGAGANEYHAVGWAFAVAAFVGVLGALLAARRVEERAVEDA